MAKRIGRPNKKLTNFNPYAWAFLVANAVDWWRSKQMESGYEWSWHSPELQQSHALAEQLEAIYLGLA